MIKILLILLTILIDANNLKASQSMEKYMEESFQDTKSYKMPSAKNIKEILSNTLDTDLFDEKTKLSQILGEKTCTRGFIIIAYTVACRSMRNYLVQDGFSKELCDIKVEAFFNNTKRVLDSIFFTIETGK